MKKVSLEEHLLAALIDYNKDQISAHRKQVNFVEPIHEILIPIGNDEVASLILTEDALEELRVRLSK